MQTVVLYDGMCALCNQSVRWVKRLDWQHAIGYTDLQDWTTVHARYPQLDYGAISGAMHVVGADGAIYVGYESVRQIIRALPLVSWLFPRMNLPGLGVLGPKVYHWIASHRYQLHRISGGPTECQDGTCKRHGK